VLKLKVHAFRKNGKSIGRTFESRRSCYAERWKGLRGAREKDNELRGGKERGSSAFTEGLKNSKTREGLGQKRWCTTTYLFS